VDIITETKSLRAVEFNPSADHAMAPSLTTRPPPEPPPVPTEGDKGSTAGATGLSSNADPSSSSAKLANLLSSDQSSSSVEESFLHLYTMTKTREIEQQATLAADEAERTKYDLFSDHQFEHSFPGADTGNQELDTLNVVICSAKRSMRRHAEDIQTAAPDSTMPASDTEPGTSPPRPSTDILHRKTELTTKSGSKKSMLIELAAHLGPHEVVTSALVDSGASKDFMSFELAKALQLPLTRMDQPLNVAVANGNVLQATHRAVSVPLRLGSLNVLHDFIVLPLSKLKLVLGFTFLEKFNPLIDWRSRTLRIKHAGATHILRSGYEERDDGVTVQLLHGIDGVEEVSLGAMFDAQDSGGLDLLRRCHSSWPADQRQAARPGCPRLRPR
jgi:hypothetical protein